MTEQVLALCRAMGAGEGEEALLLPLAQAAVDRLTARLRPGTAPEDCGPAFPLAAAMAAMEGLESLSGGGVSAFTAGDLSVKLAPGQSLSARGEALLAPWLEDGGFCFRGVRG